MLATRGRSAQAGLGEAGEHRGRRIGVSLPHLGAFAQGSAPHLPSPSLRMAPPSSAVRLWGGTL